MKVNGSPKKLLGASRGRIGKVRLGYVSHIKKQNSCPLRLFKSIGVTIVILYILN
jgi:hypothetical protein